MKKEDPSKSECVRNTIKRKVPGNLTEQDLDFGSRVAWLGALGVMSWGEAAQVEAGTNLQCWET